MTYPSLMVHLNLGQSNHNLLDVTKSLARRFGSRVIGTAGGHPSQQVYADGYAGDDVMALEAREIADMLAQAKAEFCAAFGTESACGMVSGTEHHRMAWRSTDKFESLSEFAARQSRCADLVIKGSLPSGFSAESIAANTADLVLRAGRPVLLVPGAVDDARFGWILVAWKDTREARRAIADALPLLKLAQHARTCSWSPRGRVGAQSG